MAKTPTDSAKDALLAAAEKAFSAAFGAVLELRPESGDSLWVDGRQAPPKILAAAPDENPAACCWRGARDALTRALASPRAFDSAYLSGRVGVSGDMSVMTRLELQEGR